MLAEFLAQRVVELIEPATFPHLDPTQILAAIVAILGAAGLVSVRDFPLGGLDRLGVLVAEPLPQAQSSVGVELAWAETPDALVPRLRRRAEHPAVDALVVVSTSSWHRHLPREIAGVPVRSAIIHVAQDTTAAPPA